jgi:hypothetical protein
MSEFGCGEGNECGECNECGEGNECGECNECGEGNECGECGECGVQVSLSITMLTDST